MSRLLPPDVRRAAAGTSQLRPRRFDLLVAAAGALLLIRQLVHAAGTPGIDIVHVWNATHQLWHGSGAYGDPLFTYPPSSALLLSPLGLLGYQSARVMVLVLNVAAVGAAAWLTLRMLRLHRSPEACALMLLSLGAADAVASTWANGNVNGAIVLIEVLALSALRTGRWSRAGLLLGVSLALKPVLLPLLALFLVRRRWRATAVAVVVPAALTVMAWLLIPDAGRFLHVEVPFLVRGAQLPFNDTITGAANTLHLTGLPVLLPRIAIVGAVTVLLWLRRRSAVGESSGTGDLLVEAGVLLTATFLAAPMSETYYTIYLLPTLAWCAARRREGAMLIAGVITVCFATLRLPGVPGDISHMTVLALRPSLGWFLCLLGLLAVAARQSARIAHRDETAWGWWRHIAPGAGSASARPVSVCPEVRYPV